MDDGNFKFKARLVVHGNEDAKEEDIRKDTATAHLFKIRLILSLAVCYNFMIGKIDIEAAYFQSGPIKRQIYVRPPKESLLFRTVWKLLGLPLRKRGGRKAMEASLRRPFCVHRIKARLKPTTVLPQENKREPGFTRRES